MICSPLPPSPPQQPPAPQPQPHPQRASMCNSYTPRYFIVFKGPVASDRDSTTEKSEVLDITTQPEDGIATTVAVPQIPAITTTATTEGTNGNIYCCYGLFT